MVGPRRKAARVRFDGMDLDVPAGVFPPQEVSVGLVRAAIASIGDAQAPLVADVGTGCGAVALAVGRRRPDAHVHGTDISSIAIGATRRNAARHRIRNVHLHSGSLLEPLPDRLRGRLDCVVSNVPYVPPGMIEDAGLRPFAEGAGPDGLDLVRALAASARSYLRPGAMLAIQVADFQWDTVAEELEGMGYRVNAPEKRRPGRAVVGSATWRGEVT